MRVKNSSGDFLSFPEDLVKQVRGTLTFMGVPLTRFSLATANAVFCGFRYFIAAEDRYGRP